MGRQVGCRAGERAVLSFVWISGLLRIERQELLDLTTHFLAYLFGFQHLYLVSMGQYRQVEIQGGFQGVFKESCVSFASYFVLGFVQGQGSQVVGEAFIGRNHDSLDRFIRGDDTATAFKKLVYVEVFLHLEGFACILDV